MTQSPEVQIIDAMTGLLERTLHEAESYENPYQARYTVEAVSVVTKGIMEIVGNDEGLAGAQPSLDRLIATGKVVSGNIPRICTECSDPHLGQDALCAGCQAEMDYDKSR